jgi:hypothetical protein
MGKSIEALFDPQCTSFMWIDCRPNNGRVSSTISHLKAHALCHWPVLFSPIKSQVDCFNTEVTIQLVLCFAHQHVPAKYRVYARQSLRQRLRQPVTPNEYTGQPLPQRLPRVYTVRAHALKPFDCMLVSYLFRPISAIKQIHSE